KSSNEISTPTVTEKVSPPKEQIKRPPTPTIQSRPSPPTALPPEPIIPTAQQLPSIRKTSTTSPTESSRLHFMHAVARSAKSSNEISTPTVTEKVSPPKEQIKRPPTP
ncbi:unnamed protein product, partial [Adineta steineri]